DVPPRADPEHVVVVAPPEAVDTGTVAGDALRARAGHPGEGAARRATGVLVAARGHDAVFADCIHVQRAEAPHRVHGRATGRVGAFFGPALAVARDESRVSTGQRADRVQVRGGVAPDRVDG